MQSFKYSKSSPPDIGECVLALGLFDGVHIGHRALIEKTAELAKKMNLPSAVFTFNSDTMDIKGKERLFTSQQKEELISSLGADFIISAEFSELSSLGAEAFVRDILIGELKCRAAVTGSDFRFGHGREGDAALLGKLLTESGASYFEFPDVPFEGGKVSSAKIKELISFGRIRDANALLGAPYFLDGTVDRGLGLGKKLGIPTVNISLQNSQSFLKKGVYVSLVRHGGKFYTGLTNIGTCPTFGDRAVHSETYILDFGNNLYGEDIRVYLLDYLREERKFPSQRELLAEIEKNKISAYKVIEEREIKAFIKESTEK